MRRNKGKRLVEPWLDRLSAALGFVVGRESVLALKETDRLRSKFFQIVAESKYPTRQVFAARHLEQAMGAVRALSPIVRDESLVLFHSNDKYVGAIEVPSHSVLLNPDPVWGVVQEDLCGCTQDMRFGFCLEKQHVGRTFKYELTAWPDR